MNLQSTHREYGAILAQDGIPLHYGDLAKEYDAALNRAILLDRSHEGRIQLFGDSRYELLNRMSTNDMLNMQPDEGRATIFTNAHARVIDRIVAYNRDDHLLILTQPGRGAWLKAFLQKNIFFGDDARVVDITTATHMFGLHGQHADRVMAEIGLDVNRVDALYGTRITLNDATIYAVRRKEVSGSHWNIVVPEAHATDVYEAILAHGKAHGLIPAGSLTYNTIRIRAGRLAQSELNSDYIPLELGLWDEVSFNKGCYTGQEIIARMESRAKLAKTIVSLDMPAFVKAPAEVVLDGKVVGTMTSSVEAPTGDIFAIGILKMQAVEIGKQVLIDGVTASVHGLIGEQPDFILSS